MIDEQTATRISRHTKSHACCHGAIKSKLFGIFIHFIFSFLRRCASKTSAFMMKLGLET